MVQLLIASMLLASVVAAVLHKALKTPEQHHFRFFDLPPELREHIYLLTFDSNVRIEAPWYKPYNNPCTPDSRTYRPPAILATNRRMRAEASKIYYTSTVFEIGWKENLSMATDIANMWYKSLTSADQRLIKKLIIYYPFLVDDEDEWYLEYCYKGRIEILTQLHPGVIDVTDCILRGSDNGKASRRIKLTEAIKEISA